MLRSGAALSPRRATHFLLLRQKKVSKEKATLVTASLRFAAGNLRCSGQSGSRSNSASPQTIAVPDPPAPALLGASTRVFEVKNSGPGAGDGADEWFLGSDRNFAAQRSEAPEGRAAGSGNLRSDPENARSRFLVALNVRVARQGACAWWSRWPDTSACPNRAPPSCPKGGGRHDADVGDWYQRLQGVQRAGAGCGTGAMQWRTKRSLHTQFMA